MTCCNYERTQEDINRHLSVKQLMTMQDELNDFINPAWDGMLSKEHFRVAIVSELGEFLNDHGVGWKWWKAQPEADYDEFGANIEIVDVVHFYLSLLIIFHRESMNKINACPADKDTEFDQFEVTYIGSDRGNSFSGGILCGSNRLSHVNFMSAIMDLLRDARDVFEMVDILDRFVSAGGFTSEYLSAVYSAKEVLNRIRNTNGAYKDGMWEKVDVAGVEDNERLEPIVQEFLDDPTMTLDQLKDLVVEEFYDQVT